MPTTSTTVITNAKLRGLLRTARRSAKLSQNDAAAKAGVSTTWWKRIESAYETTVSGETFASMLDAVGVIPAHLTELNEPGVAELLAAHQAFRTIGDATRVSLEEYLMKAPAPEELRLELIAYVKARNMMRFREEPFADQFNPDGYLE